MVENNLFSNYESFKDILGDKYELLQSFDELLNCFKIKIQLKNNPDICTTVYIPEYWTCEDIHGIVSSYICTLELLQPKQEHKKLRRVVAVDFDGTLCKSAYPDVGVVEKTHLLVHDLIRKEKANGSIIILWTCRCGKELDEALAACKEWNIPIDYVNENDPERTAYFGADSRKISADLYIDDKATNPEELEGGGY